MGMTYPSPMMVAGARLMLDWHWRKHNGKLPATMAKVYRECSAYTDHERAAVVVALQEYYPDFAELYCDIPPPQNYTE